MTGTQVPDDPPVRPKWQKEPLTYGEWIRTAQPNQLTRAERKLLHAERLWERDNAHLVAELEAMKGHVYLLRRAMTTLSHESESHEWKRGPSIYPKGTKVRVFARVGAYVLGRTSDGIVLRLKLEWLEPVPGAREDDDLAQAIAEDATR